MTPLPHFSDETVRQALSYRTVSRSIESAFGALREGRAAIQARSRVDCGTFRLSTMGAVWADARLALVKSYGTVQGRFDFICTLFDTAGGAALATLQGNELTRFRTPALSALAVERAALRSGRLALFGAGVQGRAHLDALLERFDFREVRVVDTADPSAWCAEQSARWRRPVFACTPERAVDGADVVVTATRSKTPLFDGRRLAAGALVVAVGTSLPGGSELDDATLARAARVIVEWKPQSLAEAGEVVAGLRSGALRPERIVDLTELPDFAGPWRTHDEDVVVFKAVGVGLADLAAAALVWDAARPRT